MVGFPLLRRAAPERYDFPRSSPDKEPLMKKALWRIALISAVTCAGACSGGPSAPAPPPVQEARAAQPLDASAGAPSQSGAGFGTWLYTCSASTGSCALYTLSGTK